MGNILVQSIEEKLNWALELHFWRLTLKIFAKLSIGYDKNLFVKAVFF